MTSYRVAGTTDEITTCEQCGKPELRGTVILEALDAEGNADGEIYAGTTCAAKLTGRKATSIRNDAAAADTARERRETAARNIIAVYGPVEGDRSAMRALFFERNPGFRPHMISAGAAENFKGAVATVTEMLDDARKVLAS